MRDPFQRVVMIGCFTVVCCFLCHCVGSPMGRGAPASIKKDAEAEDLQKSILATNTALKSIKGIGRVKLQQNNQSNIFRAVWIGKRPGQFRLEVLAATGQPMLSFAGDGKRHYLLSYTDNRLYRKKVSENGLKDIISIALSTNDIVDLLSGRLPVNPGGSARIENGAGGQGPFLVLEDSRRNHVDKIFMGPDGMAFGGLERRDRRGRLLFKVVFDKMRVVDGFRVPDALTITNDDNVRVHIEVERCWVNPVVSDDQFVLEKKKEGMP